MASKPIWVWLPDQHEPTLAGELVAKDSGYSVRYLPSYLDSGVPLDPLGLRLRPGDIHGAGLPGVILDAKPSGFGQDQICARHSRVLSEVELLEEGGPDGVGAIAVCDEIVRKLNWRAPTLESLQAAIRDQDEDGPVSQTIRLVNEGIATSAGGERPKVTVSDEGRLWLAKAQDKADRLGMPALEFVAMSLARECGLTIPDVRLITVNSHQVYLVERFDREGCPSRPCRRLYASAHTVLRLSPHSERHDPRRSYLDYAYEAKRWSNLGSANSDDLPQLWRRMVFNALVGNVDDHPRNHGLLLVDGTWRLSPAFDITPIWRAPEQRAKHWPGLSMAVHLNGSRVANPYHLLASAPSFGVDLDVGTRYLLQTANHISSNWEAQLRQALSPVCKLDQFDQAAAVAGYAFAMSEHIAEYTEIVSEAFEQASLKAKRCRTQPGRVPVPKVAGR